MPRPTTDTANTAEAEDLNKAAIDQFSGTDGEHTDGEHTDREHTDEEHTDEEHTEGEHTDGQRTH